MDIQKEREAFLKWHYQAYLLENPEVDMSSAQYIYDYAHKNALCAQLRESHFAVWQAAKAQAVPEGYQLVKKELNAELMYAVAGTDDINEHLWIEQIYKGLLEAQEATND